MSTAKIAEKIRETADAIAWDAKVEALGNPYAAEDIDRRVIELRELLEELEEARAHEAAIRGVS